MANLVLSPSAQRAASAWRDIAENPWLKLREIQQVLNVSTYTLRHWLVTGRLPGAKIGGHWRVRRSAVLALVREAQGEREVTNA